MIQIKKIMTSEVFTISKDAPLLEAEKIISARNVGGIVVVENSLPVGVVTQKEITKGIVTKKQKIKDVMGMDFIVISPLTRFTDLTDHIKNKNIKRFAVVEQGKLIGLITETDVIHSIRDFTKFDQTVQEIILVVFGLATAFFVLYFSPIKFSFFA